MGIRFYNLNGFFVKKLAHGVIEPDFYANPHLYRREIRLYCGWGVFAKTR